MENLSTQDSFKIIQNVIDQRRQKYEQNGIFLLIWGALIMIAGIAHYIMMQNGMADIAWYAWVFTMIPASIITFIVGFNQGRKKAKKSQSTDQIGWLWAMSGLLALLTGFVFGSKFGIGFTAVIYIPFCFTALASALILKNYLWVVLSIIATIIAYSSVFISWEYHPIVSAVVALFIFLIPGIQLYMDHKKRHHV